MRDFDPDVDDPDFGPPPPDSTELHAIITAPAGTVDEQLRMLAKHYARLLMVAEYLLQPVERKYDDPDNQLRRARRTIRGDDA